MAKRGHDCRQGRQDRHKTELRGYRALRGRVLAGGGQQEQGESTYPGGDPALSLTGQPSWRHAQPGEGQDINPGGLARA